MHRIGQTEDVFVYDIYCPDTIDEFIIDCLDRKEGIVESFKREIERWKRNMQQVHYEILSSEKDSEKFYTTLGPFFCVSICTQGAWRIPNQ